MKSNQENNKRIPYLRRSPPTHCVLKSSEFCTWIKRNNTVTRNRRRDVTKGIAIVRREDERAIKPTANFDHIVNVNDFAAAKDKDFLQIFRNVWWSCQPRQFHLSSDWLHSSCTSQSWWCPSRLCTICPFDPCPISCLWTLKVSPLSPSSPLSCCLYLSLWSPFSLDFLSFVARFRGKVSSEIGSFDCIVSSGIDSLLQPCSKDGNPFTRGFRSGAERTSYPRLSHWHCDVKEMKCQKKIKEKEKENFGPNVLSIKRHTMDGLVFFPIRCFKSSSVTQQVRMDKDKSGRSTIWMFPWVSLIQIWFQIITKTALLTVSGKERLTDLMRNFFSMSQMERNPLSFTVMTWWELLSSNSK